VARDVVQVRARLTKLIGDMMGSIKADSRLQARPDIASEFEARFFEMRQTQAQHHGKWRVANIDQDPDTYLSETVAVASRHDDFYDWARRTLSGL
jgi:hypothetical protein